MGSARLALSRLLAFVGLVSNPDAGTTEEIYAPVECDRRLRPRRAPLPSPDPVLSDPKERIAAAEAKRARRAEKLRAAVERGGIRRART